MQYFTTTKNQKEYVTGPRRYCYFLLLLQATFPFYKVCN
jgi:hypothetical protein